MILACTASVISMNGTSRSNAIKGSPACEAAATSAAGSDPAYRRPSSTARPVTPTPASSVT